MHTYQLILSYDGTDYSGWQIQDNARTVAGTITETFEKIFHKPCHLLGASRTDAGVHANGQVARLQTEQEIDEHLLCTLLNRSLPRDIRVSVVFKVDNDYHPHRNVSYKEYTYRIGFEDKAHPRYIRYEWNPKFSYLDVDQSNIEMAAHVFCGTHDFSAFARVEEHQSPIRTIDNCTYDLDPEFLELTFTGKGFLRYQIRRMVAAIVTVSLENNDLSYKDIVRLLENPDTDLGMSLGRAPAHGLTLETIRYDYKKNG